MRMPHVMVGDPVGKTLVITVQAGTLISISLHQIVFIVHGFWPESENFDLGQKGYHMKGHHKRNRMTQISAS